jgi:hypothetical protein
VGRVLSVGDQRLHLRENLTEQTPWRLART